MVPNAPTVHGGPIDQTSTVTVDVDMVDNADRETSSSPGAVAPLRTQRLKRSKKKTRQRRKQQPTNDTGEDRIAGSSSVSPTTKTTASLSTRNWDDTQPYDENNKAMRWRTERDAEIAQTLERFRVREMVLRAEMEKLLWERKEALAQTEKMSAADMWAAMRVASNDPDDDACSGSGDTEPDESVQSLSILMVG